MFVFKSLVSAVLLIVVLEGGAGSKVTIPDGISFEEFADYASKTISRKFPELEGYNINSFDAMELGSLTVRNGDYLVENTNTVFSGLKTAKISQIDWDWSNSSVTARLAANVTINSQYEASGQLLYLPISTSGDITIYGENTDIDMFFKYSIFLCDSVEYIKVHDLQVGLKFGRLGFDLRTNSGCSGVDALVNAALNANWRELEPVGPPQAAAQVSKKVEVALNKFYKKVPLSELRKYLTGSL